MISLSCWDKGAQSEKNSALPVTALGEAHFNETKLQALRMKNISAVENMKWHSHALVRRAGSQQRVRRKEEETWTRATFYFLRHVVPKQPVAIVQFLSLFG